MRILGLLLVLLASSSAPQAQQRFVQACIQSGETDGLEGVDSSELCGCTATSAMEKGISGTTLDGLTAYVDADGNLDFEAAPAPVQAAAQIVVAGVFTCLFESLGDEMGEAIAELGASLSESGMTVASGAAPAPPASGATAPPAAPAPRVAPRTGSRTTQAGKGSAIRIRG